MVSVLEKIKIVTKQRVEQLKNPFGEIQYDCLYENTFVFERGKIYGIVSEYGEGGEMISAIMSGTIPINQEDIFFDKEKVENPDMHSIGWYVGKSEYHRGLMHREISAKKALTEAVKKYQRYQNVDEVVKDFHLSVDRLDYPLSQYSGEKWRASLAIGYACKKEIFCFSWMSTIRFTDILLSSGVFRFFKRLKEEGCIVILPTSYKNNVSGLADDVIEIDNAQYKSVLSDSQYFREYF